MSTKSSDRTSSPPLLDKPKLQGLHTTASRIKHSGQVFTPNYLVNLILDEAQYCGPGILQRHCMENSCGDGAFLVEIVRRYVHEHRQAHGSDEGLTEDLSRYIHGIELDSTAYECCIANLNDLSSELGIGEITWDIHNSNALTTTLFDNSMDCVIGNPPYVRVHNLDNSYSEVKKYSFASGGMTDLFLVFFELGFRMLKTGGRLCYITPSSWLNSVAGSKLRDYIRHNRCWLSAIDLGHFQPFKATTYTLISLFEKGVRNDHVKYHSFSPSMLCKRFVAALPLADIDTGGYFYLSTPSTLKTLKSILNSSTPKYVTAKNGFATLSDKVFIRAEFPFSRYLIPTIKASTGKWYKAFFPYDSNGVPIPKDKVFTDPGIREYLYSQRENLLKGGNENTNSNWHLYGRTQALKDVFREKLAVNTTIKNVQSIKVNLVPRGCGIYSGLYILSDFDFGLIRAIICTEDFISFVSSLKKYKSGGYYTFNSRDLELYVNYSLDELN